MATQKTLINGQAYSYTDISFEIVGVDAVPGFNGIPIKSISYNSTQQKAMNYENSKYATSLSYSKKEYSGSVTFSLDSMELLRDAIFSIGVTSRSITDLPATNIKVTFSNKGKINVHTIQFAAFTSEIFSGSEGADQMEVSCDFIASYVDYSSKSSYSGVSVALNTANTLLNGDDNQGALV